MNKKFRFDSTHSACPACGAAGSVRLTELRLVGQKFVLHPDGEIQLGEQTDDVAADIDCPTQFMCWSCDARFDQKLQRLE